MKAQGRRIPHRNLSTFGWWVASFVERFEFYDEDKSNPNRRCIAWENTILLKAKDRERAYKKAVAIGKRRSGGQGWNSEGRKGVWKFEGLTHLLPVYDQIEDGAEILWTSHENVAVKTVRALVRARKDLEVFDDTLARGDLPVGANSTAPGDAEKRRA